MRLDHLLSKEEEVESVGFTVELLRGRRKCASKQGFSVATASHIQPYKKVLVEAELPKSCFIQLCTYFSNAKFLVSMRLWDTPVPIPNTTVKTQAADGTILETVWESRWTPD